MASLEGLGPVAARLETDSYCDRVRSDQRSGEPMDQAREKRRNRGAATKHGKGGQASDEQ